MGLNERVAELEAENVKLKQENDQLLDIVVQMRSTLNRLIARYISSDSQEGYDQIGSCKQDSPPAVGRISCILPIHRRVIFAKNSQSKRLWLLSTAFL